MNGRTQIRIVMLVKCFKDSWSQEEAKRGQDGHKWSQEEAKINAKMGPRGRIERPREAKMEPKWSQDDARRGQEGPREAKRGQDEAKMGPRRNQHGAKIKVQKSLKKTVCWGPDLGSKKCVF